MEEGRKDSSWKKWILMDFYGKTRFFQFQSKKEKIWSLLGLFVIFVFLPGLAIFWAICGVLYYRVKFPREHGGL